MVYDGKTSVSEILSLTVTEVTNQSITLSWKYNGTPDWFVVRTKVDQYYPPIPVIRNASLTQTIKLAPGTHYTFEVTL